MAKYIYEYKNWTDFTWDDKATNALFGEVRLMQGKIIGQMSALGFSAKEEAILTALTLSRTHVILQQTAEGGRNANYVLTDFKTE